jgi:hypothetical protein
MILVMRLRNGLNRVVGINYKQMTILDKVTEPSGQNSIQAKHFKTLLKRP